MFPTIARRFVGGQTASSRVEPGPAALRDIMKLKMVQLRTEAAKNGATIVVPRKPAQHAHHHGPEVVRMDPALIKWAHMSKNRYKYFRWTKRTATLSFVYIVVVPAIVGYIGYWGEGRYDMRGKRRGDMIREF